MLDFRTEPQTKRAPANLSPAHLVKVMLTQIADQLWSLELTELVHRMEVLVRLLGTGGLPGGDSQLTQQVWRK